MTDTLQKTARIRELNDDLRKHLIGGAAVMTAGIAALGSEVVERLVKTIAVFDDFSHKNDPYEEHVTRSTAHEQCSAA
jgi:hypothetical protein